MAGFRSLLAPWVGGAGLPDAGVEPPQPGVRSLLAPWIGGARVEPPQPGVRSLLAPWIGGAGLPDAGVVPPQPAAPLVRGSAGGTWGRTNATSSAPRWTREDELAEILQIIAIIRDHHE